MRKLIRGTRTEHKKSPVVDPHIHLEPNQHLYSAAQNAKQVCTCPYDIKCYSELRILHWLV